MDLGLLKCIQQQRVKLLCLYHDLQHREKTLSGISLYKWGNNRDGKDNPVKRLRTAEDNGAEAKWGKRATKNQSHTLCHRPQKPLYKQDNTKSLLECNSNEKETRS